MKHQVYLFTDGSVHPQSGVGFGAYLLIDRLSFSDSELETKIVIQEFSNTSSTKL